MSTSLTCPLTHTPSGGRLAPPHRGTRTAPSRWKSKLLNWHRHRPITHASGNDTTGDTDEGILDVLAGAAAARRPAGVASPTDPDTVVRTQGPGTHLGMKSKWRLAFSTKTMGFADEIVLVSGDSNGAGDAPLESHSGFDPYANDNEGAAWAEALGGGISRHELAGADGEHRSTLISWLRSGQWVEQFARPRLNFKLLRGGVPLSVLVDEHTMVPAIETSEAVETVRVVEDERQTDTSNTNRKRGKRGRRGRDRRGKDSADTPNPLGGVFSGLNTTSNTDGSTSDKKASIVPTPPPPATPTGEGVLLALAARGGKIGARVWLRRVTSQSDDVASFKTAFTEVDRNTPEEFDRLRSKQWWVVHRVEVVVPEGVEAWVFDAYHVEADTKVASPQIAHQTLPGGDSCQFLETKSSIVTEEENNDASTTYLKTLHDFALPREGYVDDTRWQRPMFDNDDATTPSPSTSTVAGRGDGGHVLVRCELNGSQSPGWFVLDTGSCGNAIDPEYADTLNLPSFGKLTVVGAAAASLAGGMRRAENIKLGGMQVQSPLFMEQALSGAMRCPVLLDFDTDDTTGGGQLVGVLGTDFLQHCVLEIKAPKRVPGSPNPAKFEVFVHNPLAYETTKMSDLVSVSWQKITWISGQPHVRARVTVTDDNLTPEPNLEQKGSPVEPKAFKSSLKKKNQADDAEEWPGRLFRLSLGAGGAGCIITNRASVEWSMVERTVGMQPGGVMSAPGEDRARFARVDPQVVTGRLQKLEFKGASFETVRALTHLNGDPPDLGFSPHVDGGLCSDLFRGCDLVLDFGNNRAAVVQRERG